jgi:hypothetical protein
MSDHHSMEIDDSDPEKNPNRPRHNSNSSSEGSSNDGYQQVQYKKAVNYQNHPNNQQNRPSQQHQQSQQSRPSSSSSGQQNPRQKHQQAAEEVPKKSLKSINEALKKALEEAAQPGEGDEEPEVLPAPPTEFDPSKINPSDREKEGNNDDEVSDTEKTQQPQLIKRRMNEEEEKKPSTKMEVTTESGGSRVKEEGEFVEEEADGEEEAVDTPAHPHPSSIPTVHISPLPLSVMRERAKYIPVRLSYEERKSLRLVCAAMNVSDYTNAVDVAFKNPAKRYHTQLQYIVAFLTAIIAGNNYEDGQHLFENRQYSFFEDMIMSMLEIVRRYKITNPEKLRSEYGKLIYLMQDAVSTNIKPLLDCSVNQPVRTVYDLLSQYNGLAMLDDPLMIIATNEILSEKNKSRQMIQQEIKKKERAIEQLVKRYSPILVLGYRGQGGGREQTHTGRMGSGLAPNLSREDIIRNCLYSISDNNSFLNSNMKPITDCIELLKQYFSPTSVEEGYNLGIKEGQEGSRLSHSHMMQYHYVLQSLTLWSVIVEDMFRLWYLAEKDLLNEKIPYDLKNTGQGLQRVQPSPYVYKAMHEILVHVQQTLGSLSSNNSLGSSWVGTSVIHLGDHNVPNALVFIDKYTQISRILGPLISTLKNLEILNEENSSISRYLESYCQEQINTQHYSNGSGNGNGNLSACGTHGGYFTNNVSSGGSLNPIEKIKKDILYDFFTHGFDGSGGDNFFDAGSCIDGRLTSAWNWCSQLANKPYYPLFKLTGFSSFDGQFDK